VIHFTFRSGFCRSVIGENDRMIKTTSRSTRSVAIGLTAAAVTFGGLAFPAAAQASTTATSTQGPHCSADTICDPPTIAQHNADVTIAWTPPADRRNITRYEVVVDYYDFNGNKLGRYSIPVDSSQDSKTIRPQDEGWNPWTDNRKDRPAVISAMVVAFVAPEGKITSSGFTSTLAKAPDGSLAPGVEDKVTTDLSVQVSTDRPTVVSNSNQFFVSLKAARGAKELPIKVWFTPTGSRSRQLIADTQLQAITPSAARSPGAENYGQAWSRYSGWINYAPPSANGTITVTYAGTSREYESDNRQGNFAYPLRLATDTAASKSFSIVHSELKLIGKKTHKTKNKTQKVHVRYTNGLGPTKIKLQKFKNGNWVSVATRDLANPPIYFGSSLPKFGTHQIAGDPSGAVYSTFKVTTTKTKTKYRIVHLATSEYPWLQPVITTNPTFSVQRR